MPPPNTPEDMEQEFQRRRADAQAARRQIRDDSPDNSSGILLPGNLPAEGVEQYLEDTIEVDGQLYQWPSSGSPTNMAVDEPLRINLPQRRPSNRGASRSRSRSLTPTRPRRNRTSDTQPLAGPGSRKTHTDPAKSPGFELAALEYVGEHDDNLDCPICQSPFVEPHVIKCGHVFCADCLDKTLENSQACPIDRSRIEYCFRVPGGKDCALPAPLIIRNQLDDLRVKCPNKLCNHVCARAFVKHHYKRDCPYTKGSCPDPECDKLVTRLEAGDGVCLHQEVKCSQCDKVVELASLEEHYETECKQRSENCEFCNAEIRVHQRVSHKKVCPDMDVACRHASAGCGYKEKRKDYDPQHERQCLYGMILNMQQRHNAEMDNMRSKLASSEDQLRKLLLDRAATLSSPPSLTGSPLGTINLGSPSQAGERTPRRRRRSSRRRLSGTDLSVQESDDGSDQPIDAEARHHQILTTLDVFDSKVENLRQCMAELDARQNALLMTEVIPVKDQLNALRSDVGHIGMHVRWLLELHQKKQRAGSAAAATLNGAANANSGRSPADNGGSSGGGNTNSGGQQEGQLRYTPRRQMSGENPPRL
ncbi:uncharacterized protein E0L32_003221 [Thyridium curvatum]|uniref:Uncharacterized protein n=1 Tax=Thyridium curvatum TaxID=1093900 RepID=A0A507BC55_9PEZI|nr:uncharacterized protein E0L32_003221 [Thyridium curvatum]TPX17103.1 hypothetical protein E0L32_003221 [Thyridium curvatum]